MSRFIVFGDSIAYGKWDSKGGYVNRLREYLDTNFNIPKETNHQVYNLGIPGETTRRLVEHLEVELEKRMNFGEETRIIFQIGLNDANFNNNFHKEQVPLYELEDNYKKIIEISKKYSDRLLFLSITRINEDKLWQAFPHFKNEFLSSEVEKYYNSQIRILNELKVPFLDFYNKLDPKDFSDGIHPGDSGHELIFKEVLKYIQDNLDIK
jgi:lysophospholipase L1-like esterase